MNFAIREGLRLIANEGLENIWRRHNTNSQKLWNGLESLGMELHVPGGDMANSFVSDEGGYMPISMVFSPQDNYFFLRMTCSKKSPKTSSFPARHAEKS